MIKEFGAFCERAGCPNLSTARIFDPHGRREEKKIQDFLRWPDLGRLRDVIFLGCRRPGVDFRLKKKCCIFGKDQGIRRFLRSSERAGCPNLGTARIFDPHGRREEKKVQEFLRWPDLGRLRDLTFLGCRRPGVDFRF